MKIYTKTGDKGTTALFGGRRVSKADQRIEAYGTIDELNVYVGLLRDQLENDSQRSFLKEIQDRLFTIGSSLAADPEKNNLLVPDVNETDIQKLEKAMDEMNEHLPTLKNFILPGGHTTVSFAHLARVVCRRGERLVVALSESQAVNDVVMTYLNRLSDYFFVLSRQLSKDFNAEEIAWIPRK